jgi:hypothetical protein
MPQPASISERLSKTLAELWESLTGSLHDLSPDVILEQLQEAWGELTAIAEEFKQSVPDPGAEFLAAPDQTPKPGQLAEVEFVLMVAKVVSEHTRELTPIVETAKAIGALFDQLRSLLTPETCIRFALDLARGAHVPEDVALKLGLLIVKGLQTSIDAANDSLWTDDTMHRLTPRETDEVKEAEERAATTRDPLDPLICLVPPTYDALLSQAAATHIPGASKPSNTEIGPRVHRAVMGDYKRDHPDSLVVLDGRVLMRGAGSRRLSNFVDTVKIPFAAHELELEFPGMSAWEKLTMFRESMRTDRGRIRPDIADLTPRDSAATSTGWFEIKPASGGIAAWRELHCLYMARWDALARPMGWEAYTGFWWADLYYWDLKGNALCLILPSVDGVIPYLTFEFKMSQEAWSAVVAAVAGLASAILGKALKNLRRGKKPTDVIAGVPARAFIGFNLFAAAIVVGAVVGAELLAAAGIEAALAALWELMTASAALLATA